VTPDERWLAAVWPFVRSQLPAAPAQVAELGCGPLGGFVPLLRAAGYQAVGIDPAAPDGPWYRQAEFEHYVAPEPADAVVACVSLHHVADLGAVLDLIRAALAPGGVLIVVEWARERFDEATARWCGARLPPDTGEPSWLRALCAEWRQSGQPWAACCQSWAAAERLHTGQDILRELSTRFEASGPVSSGPYFFPDLAGTTEHDEQAAIDSGQIQPGRIQYSGRRSSGD
jgi:SAM-dependent methyltransferase